jgi:small subunit ribosomal protein S1
MSSPSERSDSEPPADLPVGPDPDVSAAPAEQPPAQEEPPRRAPIRIGTQRYGTVAPKAVPHPVLPSPPASLLAKAAALSQRPAPEAPSEEESGEPREQPSADAPAPAPDAPAKKPRKQPAQPRPLNERPSQKYPPPNIRGQLSPELELEYLEAVGDASLEEMIAGEAGEVAELEPDSRHKAKVVGVHRDNVFVEIGTHAQGALALKNFAEPPAVGTMLDVVVSRFVPAEGIYELVLPGGAVDVGDWSEVAEGMVVEARVTGHNKGGLECEVSRLRGFIPASQISMYRVEDLAQFVGQTLNCVITEANPEKRNLVLSHRAVMEREKAEAKEKLLASLEVGQVREGTVRSLQDFGAFVDLGGVDGLIHISQLSWDRIKHASEALELGQKVTVKIQKIDADTGKIGLGFRDLADNPWSTAARDFPARSRVKGRVTRLMEFGAFVRLGPGVEGLVHISELSHKRVFRVSDVLAEGQDVEVMVLSVDPDAQRISLSLKALEAKPSGEKEKAAEEPPEPATPQEPPKKRATPLKGGIGGPPTGERFGLKW